MSKTIKSFDCFIVWKSLEKSNWMTFVKMRRIIISLDNFHDKGATKAKSNDNVLNIFLKFILDNNCLVIMLLFAFKSLKIIY